MPLDQHGYYDMDRHRSQAFLYGGHDPGVCCRLIGATCLAMLGFPDQARDWANESIALGERVEHPFSLAMALSFSTTASYFRRDPEAAQAQAERLAALCEEHGFAQFGAMAGIMRGWAMAAQDRASEGVNHIGDGVATMRSVGFRRLGFQLDTRINLHILHPRAGDGVFGCFFSGF